MEALEQAYREIAKELDIELAAEGREDAKELVRRYLSKDRVGKWLLVVDNADDMITLEGTEGRNGLLEYLPENQFGMTLFTTRSSEVAQSLVGSDVVELDKMTEVEALDVMRRLLVRKEVLRDAASTTELLDELHYLPLAITQATAYINRNKVSLSAYLGLIRGTEQDVVHVMSNEIRDSTRYKQAANAVATTWLVSFEQILQQDSEAAELLQYTACIEWKAIPHSILPVVQPAARMTSAIGALCSYSFITRRDDEKLYGMHRLVHVAARIWASQRESLAETQRKAMRHLSDIFPSDEWQDREVWRQYIPHAARMNKNNQDAETEVKGRLCLQVGRCLRADGRIRDAVEWLEESRDRRQHLAKDDPALLLTMHGLAMPYEANGQVKDAVRLLEQVVAIQERVLAEDHPDRLAPQQSLAIAYEALEPTKGALPAGSKSNSYLSRDITSSNETETFAKQASSGRAHERASDDTVLSVRHGQREDVDGDNAKLWRKWKRKTRPS